MASELSKSIAASMFLVLSGDRAADSLRDLIDAELAEVREVLDSLKVSLHGCWCAPNTESETHSDRCQRARALYDKLKVED